MSFHFKVDEDLPFAVVGLLVSHGHDATTVVAQGWQGAPDAVLWERVQRERRWLLTADKGFADLRAYVPSSYAGVILLRPHEESRRNYVRLTEAALDQLDFENQTGATIVVTEHGIRIRRPQK